jgi:sulfur-carrier protein
VITIYILFFAHHADITGVGRTNFQVHEGSSLADCAVSIEQKWAGLGDLLRTSRVAVNSEFVRAGYLLQSGDEVAFIPPVSGG